MAINTNLNSAGTKEAKLRRVFWGRSNRMVTTRTLSVVDAAALPPDDGEAFIFPDSDLTNPGEIGIWDDTASEFIFISPANDLYLGEGCNAYVQDEDAWVKWSGATWVTGIVHGPASAVSGRLASYNGTSGGKLADSGVASSTDGTFAANSDAKLPTEKAVKTYVDGLLAGVSGAFHIEGTLDCSANPNYPAAVSGDVYVVSVAGKIGGGSGPNVEVGDTITCVTDNAGGTHAAVGSNWVISQGNLDAAVLQTRQIATSNGVQGGGDLSADRTLSLTTNARTGGVEVIIDGGGATITTGVKADVRVPFSGTITKATLLADASGSIVIDVWKDTYANYPPTVADTITAAAKPTLSGAAKSEDSTLTGWTTAVSAGDILRFNVDSVATVTRVAIILEILRS